MKWRHRSSLCGHGRIGPTFQASVFCPPDLNIKLAADLHSCDAHCTGAAPSHHTAHVLINTVPTVLSTPPSIAHPPYVKSTCVWWSRSFLSYSYLLIPSFDAALRDSVFISFFFDPPSLLQASLRNVMLSHVVVPVPLRTSVHQMFKLFNAWLQPERPLILSGVSFVRLSRGWRPDLLHLIGSSFT